MPLIEPRSIALKNTATGSLNMTQGAPQRRRSLEKEIILAVVVLYLLWHELRGDAGTFVGAWLHLFDDSHTQRCITAAPLHQTQRLASLKLHAATLDARADIL
jgi:hypothetical protein